MHKSYYDIIVWYVSLVNYASMIFNEIIDIVIFPVLILVAEYTRYMVKLI